MEQSWYLAEENCIVDPIYREINNYLIQTSLNASVTDLTFSHGFYNAMESSPFSNIYSRFDHDLWFPLLLGYNTVQKSLAHDQIYQQIMEYFEKYSDYLYPYFSASMFKDKLDWEKLLCEPVIYHYNDNELIVYKNADMSMMVNWCKGFLQGITMCPGWLIKIHSDLEKFKTSNKLSQIICNLLIICNCAYQFNLQGGLLYNELNLIEKLPQGIICTNNDINKPDLVNAIRYFHLYWSTIKEQDDTNFSMIERNNYTLVIELLKSMAPNNNSIAWGFN